MPMPKLNKSRADRFVWEKGDLIKMPATPAEAQALFDKDVEEYLKTATPADRAAEETD